MSLFEFVTVMISMILALSLGQLLTGLTFLAPVLIAFAVGLLSPDRSDSASNDLALQFARVRRPFALVVCAYVLAMWFDGPLLAGQAPLGPVGLLHVPILAAGVLALVTGSHRVNVLAPCVASTALVTVMLIRFLR